MSDYKISTYQNSDPITDIGEFADGSKQAKRGDKTICLSHYPDSDWYWHLDDGYLDVGPFESEDEAKIDCLGTLGYVIQPLSNDAFRLMYQVGSSYDFDSVDSIIGELHQLWREAAKA